MSTINDKYESILSEFESNILDIEEVISTKEILNELNEFLEYANKKNENYKKLKDSVENENNPSYLHKIKNTILKYKKLNTELSVKIQKNDAGLINGAVDFIKSKTQHNELNITLTKTLTNTPDADEDGITNNYDHTELEEFNTFLNGWIKDYFDECEELNVDSLLKEVSVKTDIGSFDDEDTRAIGWDYGTENTIEETEHYKTEHISIDIDFKGKESKKMIEDDLEMLAEYIEENTEHKITDKQITIGNKNNDIATKNNKKLKV